MPLRQYFTVHFYAPLTQSTNKKSAQLERIFCVRYSMRNQYLGENLNKGIIGLQYLTYVRTSNSPFG